MKMKWFSVLGMTLMAIRCWSAESLSVNAVTCVQRDDASGLVDIGCTVTCDDANADIHLTVSAIDKESGTALTVKRLWLENDITHTNALTVKSGVCQLVWDAKTDNPDFLSDAVVVSVQASIDSGSYMVVDLSGGPDAERYPITYLDAEPQDGWTDEYKTTKLVLRRIDAGMFVMGHRATDFPGTWANGLHEVTITQPFRMGLFEVTQKQYELVTGSVPSAFIGDMRPADSISWNAIRGDSSIYNWPLTASDVSDDSFMGKLRAKTGIATFDLPTEAKWEYACRAGTTTALNSGKDLSSGKEDPAMAEVGRYGYNNGYFAGEPDGKGGYDDHHTTVGSYLPNAWGLYDMHGNVLEWCLDWWVSDLSPEAVADPEGPEGGSYRLLRGGCWNADANGSRSGYRGSATTPDRADNNFGFRISSAFEYAAVDRKESEPMALDLREIPLTLSIKDLTFAQRDDKSGLVDISFSVSCDDPKKDIRVTVIATDTATGNPLTVGHIWLENDPDHLNTLTVRSGAYRLVWDAKTDNPDFYSDKVTLSVRTVIDGPLYRVVDLSGGPEADRYPVTDLDTIPEGGWTDEHKTSKLVLRRVDPGTFDMGSPETEVGRYSNETRHAVTLSKPYYMALFQTSQAQYALVTGEQPAAFPGDLRPVEQVSYADIRGAALGAEWPANGAVDDTSFMGMLRTRTSIDFDLPTSAMWEYVCRAGTTTALNSGKDLIATTYDEGMLEVGRHIYNQTDARGGFSAQHTTVGSYLPNAWGFYDMHGNVWEWCLDWYYAYTAEAVTDPVGADTGPGRVIRGGSWGDNADHCRSGYYGGNTPDNRHHGIGFRICCPAASGTYATLESETVTLDLREPPLTVELTEVAITQRDDESGLVDIGCTVTSSEPDAAIRLVITATDTETGNALAANRIWVEGGSADIGDLTVASGTHHLVWDPKADNPLFFSGTVTLSVQAFAGDSLYTVIDLSGGPDAEFYPVTYLDTEPDEGWTDEHKTTKLVLRRIEPGTFVMGHRATDFPDTWANTLHTVTISKPFLMGVFEITQTQYELLTGMNPATFTGAMRPVESVSWNMIRGDSSVYDWPTTSSTVDENSVMGILRAKTGIDTFDLPTEAQWEYACRAGTTTALNNGKDMASGAWDPAMDEVGRYGYNSGALSDYIDGKGGYDDHHTTVGSYLPNAWGLYDMHGNVLEWCLDWWISDFSPAPVTNPKGPVDGTYRLLRGGCWNADANGSRSGYRGSATTPDRDDNNFGFRICSASGKRGCSQVETLTGEIDLYHGAMFVEPELTVEEGDAMNVTVFGGDAEMPSSIKVYLTYNTAVSSDLDLRAATISGSDGAVMTQGISFPLTLSWAAGETGERTITIPTKADRNVEGDELLTLQLAEPVNMAVSEVDLCSVVITDTNDKTLKASVTPYRPKAGETVTTNRVTVTGTEGGFVAGTGDYTSGTKLTLTAEARPGWTFKGWTLNGNADATVSGNAKFQIVVTAPAAYTAHFERIPYMRGLADPANGGKVTGSALCAAGKRITLKATANKNFTFAGWYANGSLLATTTTLVFDRTAKPQTDTKTVTVIPAPDLAEDVTCFARFIPDPRVSVAIEDSAGPSDTAGKITGAGLYAAGKSVTLKATANKGHVFSGWYMNDTLLSRSASYTFTMLSNDMTFTARFVTVEEDRAAITFDLDGTALEPAATETRTTICGVAVAWPITSDGRSDTTVKAAGLPAGLSLVQDKMTKAYSVTGVPTTPSRIDSKTHETVPSTVKFTVTTAGRATQTYAVALTILPLPDWTVGNFNGFVRSAEGDYGSATLTISSAGKISGKMALTGTNWTFSATGLAVVPPSDPESGETATFTLTADLKAGKAAIPFTLAIRPDLAPEAAGEPLTNATATGGTDDGSVAFTLRRTIWKDKVSVGTAKAILMVWSGVYTVALQGEGFGDGYLSLTVDGNGSVKANGKLPDGTAVSASSTLNYDGERGRFETYLYLAPSAYKGGAFALLVGFPEVRGALAESGIAYWVSNNPQATLAYGEGFALMPTFVGAYYNKLADLRAYYAGLSFETEKPALSATRKETFLDETTNRKVTETHAVAANPAETLNDCLVTVNEKGTAFIVEKTTKPLFDKETGTWFYGGTNDGALTFSFTAATGIFKGSFTFWYDYLSARDATTGKETLTHTSKKVNYEGIMVQGQALSGFFLWDMTGRYADEKTGKEKTYSCKQSFPVHFLSAPCEEE